MAPELVGIGTEVFSRVKGVDHAGNKTQITENPKVGMYE
jgi:hypothetical protein